MEGYFLNVQNDNIGCYLSSEQIDMLSIIQCTSHEELIDFVFKCKQLKGCYEKEEFNNPNLESLKRIFVKKYQDTLVLHNSDQQTIINNTFRHLGLNENDIIKIKEYLSKNLSVQELSDYFKKEYPENYMEILKQANRFVSVERDQNKDQNLYEELLVINENLSKFDTILIGSGRPEIVINRYFENNEDRYDKYFAERDLAFAKRNNKHVRYHSLLTKHSNEKTFVGMSKDEIIEELTKYVKSTIDFINNYNMNNKLNNGTPVINSIDLFNELISFKENADGQYENIWGTKTKYEITTQDICQIFEYAKINKASGMNYLYNEPFLEDSKRRKKVLEEFHKMNKESPGLIDTLGTQMHISMYTTIEQIRDCFKDLKQLQDNGFKIQITEFDLSLSKREYLDIKKNNPSLSNEQIFELIYKKKGEKIQLISSIINEVGIKLDGISYWSLTDLTDCNLERVRTQLLDEKIIGDINEFTTACGGLFPTYIKYKNIKNNNQYEQIFEEKIKQYYEYPELLRMLPANEQVILRKHVENYEKKLMQEEQQYQQNKPKQKILEKKQNNTGFVDILVLSLLTGFLGGVLTTLILLILK